MCYRYSPNSDNAFPNVVKDVKKSISYVQMGAQQAWNRCCDSLAEMFDVAVHLIHFL